MLSKIHGINLTLKELPDSQYGEEVFVKRDAPGVTMDPFAV